MEKHAYYTAVTEALGEVDESLSDIFYAVEETEDATAVFSALITEGLADPELADHRASLEEASAVAETLSLALIQFKAVLNGLTRQ